MCGCEGRRNGCVWGGVKEGGMDVCVGVWVCVDRVIHWITNSGNDRQ